MTEYRDGDAAPAKFLSTLCKHWERYFVQRSAPGGVGGARWDETALHGKFWRHRRQLSGLSRTSVAKRMEMPGISAETLVLFENGLYSLADLPEGFVLALAEALQDRRGLTTYLATFGSVNVVPEAMRSRESRSLTRWLAKLLAALAMPVRDKERGVSTTASIRHNDRDV
ncbi:MAG: hypothetical protein ACE5JL_04280 [Dehalococcoidia bacterium]